MFSKFNKQIKTIFLDPASDSFEIEDDLNVVLSPSLYWVKKVSLPVKYLRDAKSLLPSLFEDTLPEGSYSYSTYKSGDDFFIFAYEDKFIIDTLSSKGISSTQVKGVYFAQSELSQTQGAIKINETQSIYVKDEIVILVPCCWIEESGSLDIGCIDLSKHSISLKQFGHIVNDKSLYMLASIFSLLIVLVALEYFITVQKISTTTELKDELFSKHGLKSTMIQNRSMLNEYKTIHKRQSNLREYSSYILSMSLVKQQRLLQLSMKGKKLIAAFSGVEKGDEASLQKYLKSKKLQFTSNFKDKSWYVEIEL